MHVGAAVESADGAEDFRMSVHLKRAAFVIAVLAIVKSDGG